MTNSVQPFPDRKKRKHWCRGTAGSTSVLTHDMQKMVLSIWQAARISITLQIFIRLHRQSAAELLWPCRYRKVWEFLQAISRSMPNLQIRFLEKPFRKYLNQLVVHFLFLFLCYGVVQVNLWHHVLVRFLQGLLLQETCKWTFIQRLVPNTQSDWSKNLFTLVVSETHRSGSTDRSFLNNNKERFTGWATFWQQACQYYHHIHSGSIRLHRPLA